MSAHLATQPGSISNAQMRALHAVMRKRGLDREQVKDQIGVESFKDLSRADASELIERLGGGGLPNPPGQAPPPPKRPTRPGVYRMITAQHVEQIERLGGQYFGDARVFCTWLSKNFKVPYVSLGTMDDVHAAVRALATADRAGDVIMTLKQMLARRRKAQA